MNALLEKFDQVEIKADARISEADRVFCQAHQEAYEKARSVLRSAAILAAEGEKEQEDALNRAGKEHYSTYLSELSSFRDRDFFLALEKTTHKSFIENIVNYFANKYHVSLNAWEICNEMIPMKPEENRHPLYYEKPPIQWTEEDRLSFREYKETYEEEVRRVSEELRSMAIRYEEILDRIFSQLGGLSFQDVAIKELKDACRSASSNYHGSKSYTQKKAVLSFDCGCSHDSWYSQWHSNEPTRFDLHDSMKKIVRGLSYFEMGTQSYLHYGLSDLLGYHIEGNDHSVNGEKVQSVKLFKNGRVDVRFQSEALARQFAEEFLAV